jgi:hypothetical protein
MVSVISTRFAEIALDRSQDRRYQYYSEGLLHSENKGIFDDRIEKAVQPYLLDPTHVAQDLKAVDELDCGDGETFSRSYYRYDKIVEALDRITEPSVKSFRWNQCYQWALEEVKREFSRANLRMLIFSTDQDVAENLPKTSTHSGLTFLITGEKDKGSNIKGLCQRMLTLEDEARLTGNFGIPILIAHRTQGSAHDEMSGEVLEEGKHKTRMVCIVDLTVIAIELKFAKPLQEYLSRNVGWYSGGKSPAELRARVRKGLSLSKFWYSLDYSSYDQTISDWMIEDAFDVIASAFNFRNEDERNLLKIVCDSFIHKDFLVQGYKTVKADKGVASGSMFTQMVDSIVNRIMILTYLRSKHPRVLGGKDGHISNIMGDDHQITMVEPLDLHDLSGYLLRNFGIKLNPTKCARWDKHGPDPWYLSRLFKSEGEWRHPNVLYDRMVFPERFRPYDRSVVIPEDIVYMFIQTYPLGMEELMDVKSFMKHYDPKSRKDALDKVDSTWLPGSYAYMRDYC